MANNTIQKFEADCHRFAEAIGKTPREAVRMLALQCFTEFTNGNPVDTGYSRANWGIYNGAPATSPKGERPKKGTVLSKPTADLSDVDGNGPVFITNPVDYVRFLEEGSSTQAPSGFIAVGIARVEAKVDTIIERAVKESVK